MTAGLLLAVVSAFTLQGAEVTASVDRTRLTVGEEVMLTVRARTRSTEPLEIMLPALAGFAIVGSRDLTEVAMSGAAGPVRTTVRELQLRAEQPGAVLIGPVRVRQGESTVATEPILLTVDSAETGIATAVSPLVRGLLETADPPRRADEVALTVIVPDDTVLVGQQTDLVAAAWVPRDLRERMRRPPMLTLVTPEGVWAYPPSTPTAVAASRQVSGKWMDLFITHQIVFPLAPGRITVSPASVDYAVPVTFSFFSREERYTLRSDSLAILVLPLPAAGRPAGGGGGDCGVVGQGLTLDLRIEPAQTRVGEPLEVSATVTGVGNVALWPEPVLRWPAGFRSYPAETEVHLEPTQGRIGGSKTFRFLAVPDSAGSVVLPEVRYDYFDIGAGRYQTAIAAPRVLAVAAGAEPRAARALPPLLPGGEEPWADRLVDGLGTTGWLAIAVLPPLLVWLTRRRPEPAPAAADRASPTSDRTRLGRLEHDFLTVLASHVPDAFARDGDGLAQALRAAGIDSAVADHVKRLRDRLRAARYGPRGLGDAAELAAEIEQVLRVLGAESGGGGRRRRVVVGALLLAAAASTLQAQAHSAEALYEAGALRAAADSFAARAAGDPGVAAHWYNLGATLYRAAADGKATAAWTLATRLAPRDAVIRRARRLLPAPDLASEQLLAVGWATPGEWALIVATAWGLLWLLALGGGAAPVRGRRAVLMVVLGAVVAGAAMLGGGEQRRRARTLAVVVANDVPVRAAPYGGASAAAMVHAGAALIVGERYGRWIEVRRPDGVRGWVLAGEIVRL
ncbi:MAG TPA: BatD family protein [Gemmatimonadales bacterium]|nr:BatD family protein [Gemmatimonadales bacterium]